jgi:hypothetical protein
MDGDRLEPMIEPDGGEQLTFLVELLVARRTVDPG